MKLIVDIGNTSAKIALFQKNEIYFDKVVTHEELNVALAQLLKEYDIGAGIIASVAQLQAKDLPALTSVKKLIWLDANTPVPFLNHYDTPKSLGVDRIALVSAAIGQFQGQNCLIIDAGTCITYDIVTAKGIYLGGAISPGISIRYKALHDYTAKLPLLNPSSFELTGSSTEKSIHSGILNGVLQEIKGIIHQYSSKYSNLTVVLTGGDTIFLAKMLKSSIFATPNFLLEGLNRILIHNLDE